MTPEAEAKAERERLEAEERARLRRMQDDEDMQAVMATAAGRRFVWRLLTVGAGLYRPSFAGEATHAAAHAEGQRAVGLALMLELQRVAAADYVLMVTERVAELPPVVVPKPAE